ncbi:hypothetical protein H4S14_001579 [Agrobacterium vitis]|nr:hypothetical protein [Agrobacterium vitis]MBE1437835.1 hypothetical protein [Agrobacterium vitis]
MKSYGSQPCIGNKADCAPSLSTALTAGMVLLAYLLLCPWLPVSTFGPAHSTTGDVDFSAVRTGVHLAARNENSHIRGADRDDGKGGAPPDAAPYILSGVLDVTTSYDPDRRFPLIPLSGIRFFPRESHQPRAPPLLKDSPSHGAQFQRIKA